MDPSNTKTAEEPLSPSPSSSTIARKSSASQTESDALAMQRFAHSPLRRSSSRIQQWVHEQRKRHSASSDSISAHDSPDDSEPPFYSGTPCHAYLAYPHLVAPARTWRDDASTVESYVLVDDDEDVQISHRDRVTEDDAPVTQQSPEVFSLPAPSTPRKAYGTRPGSALFVTPSPLRNFHLSFSHSRRSSGPGPASLATPPQTPSHSPGHRPTTSNDAVLQGHAVASPLSASQRASCALSTGHTSVSLNSPSAWRLKRPTVLGHFRSPSEEQPNEITRPRPSSSSSVTHSSTTTTQPRTSLDTVGTTPKSTIGSIRSQSPAMMFKYSPSLWSLPADASHFNDPPGSTKIIACDREKEKSSTVRIPLALKGHSGNMPGFGTMANILNSPKAKKKRKLIITGIPVGDQPRFERVKRWCESFGEVNQITRVPNGDLHIDFRRAEVADTVCRLHARVYINGVGSVGLSWFTGKRP